ncbi:MAG: hypothetical protein IC227_02755 [Enterococcus lacertideformus]|uniref:Uncharacterized protein n=1 Tax=Enterococcus lacertideformus TaxID=2771493 RepID=A0A931AXF6_9ENTE|nr:hypothetical protein [Enterococcus lacertideformus]
MKKQLYFEENFFTLPLYKPDSYQVIKQSQNFGYQLQKLVPNLAKKAKQKNIHALFSNILALNDLE